MTRSLTLDDIVDLRDYEKERDEFRARIIQLKKRRRLAVGPYLTLLFENRETVRFQIQEMARAERLSTDESINNELRAYNSLIPEPGHLCATLFIELTSDDLLREWLPKLVGIERHVTIRSGSHTTRSVPEADHESHLTRDEITSSVHYLTWEVPAEMIEALASGGSILVDHPEYRHEQVLDSENISELLADLRA